MATLLVHNPFSHFRVLGWRRDLLSFSQCLLTVFVQHSCPIISLVRHLLTLSGLNSHRSLLSELALEPRTNASLRKHGFSLQMQSLDASFFLPSFHLSLPPLPSFLPPLFQPFLPHPPSPPLLRLPKPCCVPFVQITLAVSDTPVPSLTAC